MPLTEYIFMNPKVSTEQYGVLGVEKKTLPVKIVVREK